MLGNGRQFSLDMSLKSIVEALETGDTLDFIESEKTPVPKLTNFKNGIKAINQARNRYLRNSVGLLVSLREQGKIKELKEVASVISKKVMGLQFNSLCVEEKQVLKFFKRH